jgi:hypothetical protein
MLGDDKRRNENGPIRERFPTAFIGSGLSLARFPIGKIASTNLSCANHLVFDVACRYLFVT